ncbi:MAG: C25 family peptidase propeptide domain-containing protein, partial [Cyclobacteriaceae bacterium]
MKTIAIITACMLTSILSYSQEWVEFSANESTSPQLQLSTSNDTLVEFEIEVPGMYSTAIDSFNRVEILNHFKMDSVGFPEIPVISYLVAIPSCDSVILNLTLLDSLRFSDVNIYPAPELVPDTLTGGAIALVEEFSCDTTAYNTDDWLPGTLAETIDKGAIRDQNVVRVLFYPVQFNPLDKEILAFSKAKITLAFYNSSGSIQKNAGFFNEVVGNTLINYNSNGLNASVSCGAGLSDTGNVYRDSLLLDQKIGNNCDYLIITPDELFYDEEIWSLANHRAGFNGFDVAITKMGAINAVFSDTLEIEVKMKFLIRNTYNDSNALHTYDGKLAYVNLFGDVIMESGSDGVPTYYEDPDHGGYDVYFTQLTYDSIAGDYDP